MKQTQKGTMEAIPLQKIAPIETDAACGLTAEQVRLRAENGYRNDPVEPPIKTTKQIIRDNVLTYFNILFFILAACVALVQSWNNMMFLGVVVINTAIGIFQELRSRKVLDELSILAAPHCQVVRDGETAEISTGELVRDDIVIFSAGNQICADGVVAAGSCRVNEALLTGEADEITKTVGDPLLSGSYVVSGTCRARLTAVGEQSFAAGLTMEAKRSKAIGKTGMMRDLSILVKWIGLAIIPLGILMFCKEYLQLERDIATAVTSTVASLVGMIPEGLYLLTTLALMAGMVRLAQRKTLIHDMDCIETLARVDVLCVDKTGTITEDTMCVSGVDLLAPEQYGDSEIAEVLAEYVASMEADNETMIALKAAWPDASHQVVTERLPFSSERKYSGVTFETGESWLLGAPDILLGNRWETIRRLVEKRSAGGNRVLLLAALDGIVGERNDLTKCTPVALILLDNQIRKKAEDTFRFFREQNVTVKVISGDHPGTAANAAARAGIPNAERWIDARMLKTKQDVQRAAETYTVFGRVTPEQKRELVRAMQAEGHTVAMTGDGVNDVLALKEADCSVAMASGSEVACRVSQVVLLNSDFSSMPQVVMEGRRVINNIERSASLYLIKNIFSFCLALITLFFALPYPFSPTQLSLVSALTIGVPSFVLAMEPNSKRIQGRFLPNAIYHAIPAAIADVLMIVTVILFYLAFDLTEGALSTICTCIMGTIGLLAVHRLCKPYTVIRKVLMTSMIVCFMGSVLFLGDLFTLSDLLPSDLLVLVVVALLAKPVLDEVWLLQDQLRGFLCRQKNKKRTS